VEVFKVTNLLAIDYETDYSREYSVSSLGAWAYVRDHRFCAHTVSMWGEGLQYAGKPSDAPWDEAAKFTHWVSHNAAFDEQVHGQLDGWYPRPEVWDCTADLMGYLQHPRSLKDACRVALGLVVDKSVRDDMASGGNLFLSRQQVEDYALEDARLCYLLWEKFSHRWPERERELSRHTRLMAARGIGFDEDAAKAAVAKLAKQIKATEAKIPWVAAGKPPTSRLELLAECGRLEIDPPETTAEKSAEWQAWLDAHEKKVPWVRAINKWRRLNRTRTVVEAMLARSAHGRLHGALRYYGAAVTGRWSGSDGLNMQNLNSRDTEGGVDLRGLIKPPAGKVFVVSDLAQIEPRVLAVLSGDTELLAGLRQGLALYEAHARATMMWDGGPLKKEQPRLYALAKARVLGLSYGAGATTFQRVAKVLAGLDLDEIDAKTTVDEFRQTNPRIVGLWERLDKVFARAEDVLSIRTKAGRPLRYFHPRGGECEVTKGGKRVRYWGSKLCENLIQATARDVMADMVLQIEAAGIPVVLHVHDEIVCEVPAETAERDLARVKEIMSTPPDWLPELPVECEAQLMEAYGK
jgi:DNA polymerase I-like protein with 3'-5' exonuclease and polymerase domains